ncbi:MAG: TonB-dependent receptor [Calditrichaeota bacterium]|nr:TonB-dependent receptor [Calditrichota bacterium]
MDCKRILFFLFSITMLMGLYKKVNAQNDQDIEALSLDALLNTEISTASKYEQTTSEAPASVTIITAEDIERYGYHTIQDVLQGVQGFYSSYDRDYNYQGVRGFSRPCDYNDRILVLINGQTANEPFYNAVGIGTDFQISLSNVERVEIVRGPGSALYGTSAMFAVINVITKNSTTFEGIQASVETGSYGRKSSSANVGKQFDNGLGIVLSGQWTDIKGQNLYYKEYNDPSTNNGMAMGLDWDKFYRYGATISFKEFKLQAFMNSREKGIPTGAWGVVFNNPHSKTLDENQQLQLEYSHSIGVDKNIMLRAYYDHYYYNGVYPYEDEEDGETYSYDIWDSNDAKRLGSELQFRWDIRSNNRLIAGAEYQKILRANYRYWDARETYYDEDFPYNTQSFYLQDEYQARDNLSFTGGIRWDNYSDRGKALSPRGAIVYHPAKTTTLKFLYGEAFRVPNLYEVYYVDPWAGWKPNLGLDAERIKTIEFVWEQRLSEGLMGTLSLYNYRMNGLIDTIVDPSDSLIQFQNTGNVCAHGLELALHARFNNRMSGYINCTFQKAKDIATGEKLTNSPSSLFKMGLVIKFFNFLYIAPELRYETERITVYGTKTDSFLLSNINFSTRPLFGHFKLSFNIRNLFDVAYETPGGYELLQPAILQDGRNFIVRFGYSL